LEARRRRVVVDASAIVSLLIDPGQLGAAVAKRLAGRTLLAPHLLPFEVANVLRRRRNGGQLSNMDAGRAFDSLRTLPIGLWPFDTLASSMWRNGHHMSSYDAAYVALAELIDCPLVTCDTRLARAPGIACTVEVFA
jgi:predicted nucleic acid-binding protein